MAISELERELGVVILSSPVLNIWEYPVIVSGLNFCYWNEEINLLLKLIRNLNALKLTNECFFLWCGTPLEPLELRCMALLYAKQFECS